MALICSLVQLCTISRASPTMAWLLMARLHLLTERVERLLIWQWDNWKYRAIISEKNPRRPSRYQSGSVCKQTGLRSVISSVSIILVVALWEFFFSLSDYRLAQCFVCLFYPPPPPVILPSLCISKHLPENLHTWEGGWANISQWLIGILMYCKPIFREYFV